MSREIIIEAKVKLIVEVEDNLEQVSAEELANSVMENTDYEFESQSDNMEFVDSEIEEWNVRLERKI